MAYGAKAGAEILYGIDQATTWGTAVVVQTGDGILLTGESITDSWAVEVLHDESSGQSWRTRAEQGRISISGGALDFLGRFDSMIWRPIAGVIGSDAVTTPTNGVLTRLHTMVPEVNPTGDFYTIVFPIDDGAILYCDSWKPTGMTMSGARSEFVNMSVRGEGNLLLEAEGSGTNTTTTAATITVIGQTDGGPPHAAGSVDTLMVADGAAYFKMGNQSGATATFEILDWEFVFDRNATSASAIGSTAGQNEPIMDGYADCTLKVNAELTTEAGIDMWVTYVNDTRYYGEIYYEGDQIESVTPDYNYYMYLQFRYLRLSKPALIKNGPSGKIGISLEFDCLSDSVTTLSSQSDSWSPPFRLLLQNQTTAAFVS